MHAYWLLETPIDARDERIEPTLRGLATKLGADRAAAEIARLMRLPGTFNQKYEPPRVCRTVDAHWDRLYDIRDFQPFAKRHEHSVKLDDLAPEIPEGRRNAFLTSMAGTMRHRGFSVWAIEAALFAENQTRCKPPLPKNEVRGIASSIGRYQPEVSTAPRSFHSAHIGKELGQKPFLGEKAPSLPFKTAAQIERETTAEIPWRVRPYVADGAITEVDGKVKLAGKSTLVTHMCRAVLDGARFMDQPTRRCPVVYLTEQPPTSWRLTLGRAGILGREDFSCLYFKDIRGLSWQTIADGAIAECKRIGARLLVVDTLSQFAGISGDSENDAGEALQAMAPLQVAAGEGIAVIVVRHERKAGGSVGESGRGSSAFGGAADEVLSIRRPEGKARKTLRAIHAVGRFDEAPEEMIVELTLNGYVALGTATDVAAVEAEDAVLRTVPAVPEDALDQVTIVESTGIARATIQRAISKLRDNGKLEVVGKGKRGHPFKYFVQGQETPRDRASNSFCPDSDPLLGKNKSKTLEGATAVAGHQNDPHQKAGPIGKPLAEFKI